MYMASMAEHATCTPVVCISLSCGDTSWSISIFRRLFMSNFGQMQDFMRMLVLYRLLQRSLYKSL